MKPNKKNNSKQQISPINTTSDIQKEFLVDKIQLMCFGAAPVTNLYYLRRYAGAHMFSELCAFKFHSTLNRQYPDFDIAFVAKPKSRIGARAPINPSQWYIIQRISETHWNVLDAKTLMVDYHFDIELFLNSDYFKKISKLMKQTCQNGLVQTNEFIKTISKSEDKLEAEQFIGSIQEAIPHITNIQFNNASWELRDHDNSK